MVFVNQYETVFILTPVLSEEQMRDAVEKFRKILIDNGAELVHEENWGLRKFAYPIQKKKTGFYQLFEYKAAAQVPNLLDVEFRRDERVLRYLTVKLDKYGIEYNEKRRKGELKRVEEPQNEA